MLYDCKKGGKMKKELISAYDIVKCLNQSNDGFMISDSKGVILYASDSYYEMTKLDESILGHNIGEYEKKAFLTNHHVCPALNIKGFIPRFTAQKTEWK